MNDDKRPLPVIIIGCAYLAVGIIGFIYHGKEFLVRGTFEYDVIWIELTEFIAIVCGVFLLRGENWARWLALAWIVFHVIISAFDDVSKFAIHCLFCALIAWFLFRPATARYFRNA